MKHFQLTYADFFKLMPIGTNTIQDTNQPYQFPYAESPNSAQAFFILDPNCGPHYPLP